MTKPNIAKLKFYAVLILAALVFMPLSPALSTGAEFKDDDTVRLIMFEEVGCEYCEMWEEEVGIIYHKTPEGKFAPLTRVFIGEPKVKFIKRIIYTPTFVVLKGKTEIGRVLGYPGEEFFWGMLQEILVRAGYKPAS